MTDINTAIALSKGYQFANPVEDIHPDGRKIWFVVESGFWREIICPNYEHDANLYMGLFIEFPVGTTLTKTLDGYLVRNPGSESVDPFAQLADAIGTAICLAYCKLKGIEVVG